MSHILPRCPECGQPCGATECLACGWTSRDSVDPAQNDMFSQPDRALARRTDPETSHAAAAKVPVPHRQQQVLDALLALAGAGTSSEIGAHLHLARDSISPRMKQLERKGYVGRSTLRRDGQTVWLLRGDRPQ